MKLNFFLLSQLIRRDVSVRYAGSFGGGLWALGSPLLLCALYSFVFSVILRIPPPEDFGGGYTEFLLAGLIPWIYLQEGIVRSAGVVPEHAHLVKKVAFPVELLVVSVIGSSLLLELAALVVFGSLAAALGTLDVDPLLLAAGLGLQVLVMVGACFALAALTVLIRDLSQLLGPLMTFFFYLTPVLYPEALVPASLRPLLAFNPVRDVMALFRAGLLGTQSPPLGRVAVWAAVLVVISFASRRFFVRCKRDFADVL